MTFFVLMALIGALLDRFCGWEYTDDLVPGRAIYWVAPAYGVIVWLMCAGFKLPINAVDAGMYAAVGLFSLREPTWFDLLDRGADAGGILRETALACFRFLFFAPALFYPISQGANYDFVFVAMISWAVLGGIPHWFRKQYFRPNAFWRDPQTWADFGMGASWSGALAAMLLTIPAQ